METITRDYEAYRDRRLLAVELFEQGAGPSEVGRALGVSRQSAHAWQNLWKTGGWEALAEVGHPGAAGRLTEEQWLMVEQALVDGPTAHGFENDMWTLPRVSVVIERLTGVLYHPDHLSRLMNWLGWSPQKPERRASERNEEEVSRWVDETWPAIKKKRGNWTPG